MSWAWGFIIQAIAGFLGGHAAAGLAHEQRFGFVGHSITGLIGGALSGALLQNYALTIVTGSGSQNPSTLPEIVFIHILCGGVAGGIVMLAIGFVKSARSDNPPRS